MNETLYEAHFSLYMCERENSNHMQYEGSPHIKSNSKGVVILKFYKT